MGTTTNNGWPTPVATDLVKDGWEAIKDLGDAIDTTLRRILICWNDSTWDCNTFRNFYSYIWN
jgi:hypothetical protein